MKRLILGMTVAVSATACTNSQLIDLANQALAKAKQGQGATPASASPNPSPTVSASPTTGASPSPGPSTAVTGATGISAAALADPYAVGRKWRYRKTTKAAGNTTVQDYVLDFLSKKGDIVTVSATTSTGSRVDDKQQAEIGPSAGRPFLWNAIKDANYAFWAEAGTDRTVTTESAAVIAGTFDAKKIAYRGTNIMGQYTIDSLVSDKLGLLKYAGTTVFTGQQPVSLEIELVSVE